MKQTRKGKTLSAGPKHVRGNLEVNEEIGNKKQGTGTNKGGGGVSGCVFDLVANLEDVRLGHVQLLLCVRKRRG